MTNTKHIGRIIKTGRKCLVAYRTLPGDAYNCLVVPTESIEDSQHDSLINLVESNSAQSAYEFAEVLARNVFPDGSVMLASLHRNNKLIKLPTDQVEMLPNMTTRIRLDELNVAIAEQKGIAIDELALTDLKSNNAEVKDIAQVNEVPTVMPEVELSPEEHATKLRGQADKLSKQAAELRRQAETLSPTKRNVTKKTKQ